MQQPAGVHQFVEGVADDFRIVQQVPLLSVDVAGREAVRAVERAGFDSAGQFAGRLALQGLAEGEDAPGVGFQIVAPAGGAARGGLADRAGGLPLPDGGASSAAISSLMTAAARGSVFRELLGARLPLTAA